MAGSYGSSIFSFLSNLHIALHRGCTNLHSHQQWVPVSPYPHQHLLLLLPINMVILTGVRWTLSAVLIFISFISREVEHFFVYLLAKWSIKFPLRISRWIHVLVSSSGYWFFGGWVFWLPWIFWILFPYWMNSWQKIFTHSVGSLLSLLLFCVV
jgi:hypothetical protein